MAQLRRKAAITGMGCLCALGIGVDECREGLFKGVRNPAPPRRFNSRLDDPFPVFELPGDFYETPAGRRGPNETVSLAFAAVSEALEQAGHTAESLKGKRVGVLMGTTVGSSPDIFLSSDVANGEVDFVTPPPEERLNRWRQGNPALCVAREFNCSGPVQNVVNACSSGADAIALGASWIEQGVCDIVIAGGADALSELTYFGFIRLMNTDRNPCKPFDVSRKGLNLGEGAAAVILEAADVTSSSVQGYVLGSGTCSDAYHMTAPRPDGAGLKQAIAVACEEAGCSNEDISFVNVHGTGTQNNDAVESVVLRETMTGIPFSATKGMTGHTLGAAGALEAVFTLMTLQQGELPPSPGFEEPDPKLEVVPGDAGAALSSCVALSFSLAFGGNNTVLALEGADGNGCPCERKNTTDAVPMNVAGMSAVGSFGDLQGQINDQPVVPADTSALESFFSKAALRRSDHFSKLALLGAGLALKDAGLIDERPKKMGIVMATAQGPVNTTVEFFRTLTENGPQGASPLAFSLSVHNIPAAMIAQLFKIPGPVTTVGQFETSAVSALMTARTWLHEGRADCVLFGVVDEYSELLDSNCDAQASPGEGAVFFCLTSDAEVEAKYGTIEKLQLQNTTTQAASACEESCASGDEKLFAGQQSKLVFELAQVLVSGKDRADCCAEQDAYGYEGRAVWKAVSTGREA